MVKETDMGQGFMMKKEKGIMTNSKSKPSWVARQIRRAGQ